MSIRQKIKNSPWLKKIILIALMPSGQARPRLWVKLLVNPMIHHYAKGSTIRRQTRMDIMPFNKFSIGINSTIEDYTVVNNGMGNVIIGDGVRIGISNVIIGPVKIGNNIILAQHVVASGLNHGYQDIHLPIKSQPCTVSEIVIEDDCWIGANVVITAGVTIGKHSIVAAGSVVTKDIAPFSIAAGNPARIIKQFNPLTSSWEKVQQHTINTEAA